MKKIKNLLFLVAIALISTNCENDSLDGLIEQESESDGVKDIYRYTSEDIPDIGISINTSVKRELTGKYAKNDNTNYFLDENNIIGITDSIGNKIFSFQLYVTEEQKTNNFYNVVAIKPADGTEMAPFVMEYSRNSDGSKSALAYYKLNSFLNSLEQQKSSKSSDECGEFSNSTTSTSSSSTTSSGGGGTSGSWDRESSSFSNYGSYNVTTWGASSNTTVGSTRGTVDVGYGYFMMPKDEGQREKSAKGDDSEPCPKSEWLLPVNEAYGIFHTACRSFEYEDFGLTGTKVAAIKGIEHPVLRTGRCPGVGYVAPQPTYYFTLPSSKPRAKRESAMALERAFDNLEEYFKNDIPCLPNGQSYIGLLSSKLLEFTKKEFTKIGGAASKTPPLGWNGEEHDYETNVGLFVPDC